LLYYCRSLLKDSAQISGTNLRKSAGKKACFPQLIADALPQITAERVSENQRDQSAKISGKKGRFSAADRCCTTADHR